MMFCNNSPAGASLLIGGSHVAAPLSITFCAKFAGVHGDRTTFGSKERPILSLTEFDLLNPMRSGGEWGGFWIAAKFGILAAHLNMAGFSHGGV